MITITLNGKPAEIAEETTLTVLLNNLKLQSDKCLIERNREVVAKDFWNETCLAEDDLIEIIEFVAGG